MAKLIVMSFKPVFALKILNNEKRPCNGLHLSPSKNVSKFLTTLIKQNLIFQAPVNESDVKGDV